jgi:uncharacterized protein (TIGR00299 family) protein
LRHLRDIEQILTAATLPDRVMAWSLAIFRRLAIAEGAIHGIDPHHVHFHEVGATDAIVDIVGTCLGLDWLEIDEVWCAPLPTGRGTVRAAHGRLPIPAPAVLKLMEMAQVPLYSSGLSGELVTPTGAAIATELACQFGEPPAMQLRKVGLGAGTKDLAMPNILRLWIGESSSESHHLPAPAAHAAHHPPTPPTDDHPHPHPHPHSHHSLPTATPASPTDDRDVEPHGSDPGLLSPAAPPVTPLASDLGLPDQENIPPPPDDIEQRAGMETVVVLETQVDDLSPQAIGYVYDRLLTTGALDVFTQGVTMKKSRPGHLITVITYPDQAAACEQVLLQETTTLGVRRTTQSRHRLRRAWVTVDTPLGPIRMKVAFAPGQETPLKAHPEYADCVALAQRHQVPWRDVQQQALQCWYAQGQPG